MIKKTPSFNKQIRRVYQPRYNRELSDKEVKEIEANLTLFAEGISEIAKRLHSFANATSLANKEHLP